MTTTIPIHWNKPTAFTLQMPQVKPVGIWRAITTLLAPEAPEWNPRNPCGGCSEKSCETNCPHLKSNNR